MRRIDELEWVFNSKERKCPVSVNQIEYHPYLTHHGIKPTVHREIGRVTRWRKPGSSKVLDTIDDAIVKTGLSDGMTISFHHHLRNGDKVLNLVIERIRNKGIKEKQ